jgi:hypothetical protein
MNWKPRIVSSIESSDAGVRRMGWEEAQAWCNFVLMRPTVLPDDVGIEKLEMRPEAPPGRPADVNQTARPEWTQSNRAVHRAEITGHHRRLRIKQFLYDYAPPAFDHPCLWESESVRAFPVGNLIGWSGKDFRKLQAATVSLYRTTVELSVTEGAFTDEELQSICRGLSPAVPQVCDLILNTPFADLCYQGRHREPPIAVPVGYWAHKRLPETLQVTVLRSDQVPSDSPSFTVAPPEEYGYRSNSVFIYGNPQSPQEIDTLFEHMDDAGQYLRVLVSPSNVAGGVPFPPVREVRQKCSDRLLSVNGLEVYHAYSDERYGQHEAVWQKDGRNIMLIVKPTIWTDMEWFTHLLEVMV